MPNTGSITLNSATEGWIAPTLKDDGKKKKKKKGINAADKAEGEAAQQGDIAAVADEELDPEKAAKKVRTRVIEGHVVVVG